MDKEEVKKLQDYLRYKFGNANINVKPRPRKTDSMEVFIDDEFIAILYVDEDEGERSYSLQMAILDIDLEEVPEE